MINPQEIFNRLQVAKKKQKDLKSSYHEGLNNSLEYKEICEKLKILREKKKQYEATIKQEYGAEIQEMETIGLDMKTDNELLSDAVLSTIMKGQTVEIQDEYNNAYEPRFSVKFKKVQR